MYCLKNSGGGGGEEALLRSMDFEGARTQNYFVVLKIELKWNLIILSG